MRIDLLTIFPHYFDVLDLSLLGKAQDADLLDIHTHDLRQWTTDRHRTVDDAPYGGGAGMVMRPDVWGRGIDQVLSVDLDDSHSDSARRVLAIPTPSGTPLDQRRVEKLAEVDQIILACGRYEGIDQRVADFYREQEVEVLEYSIGDYILNGGEAAALVLVESVSRLLEGVLGNPESLDEESYGPDGLIEYPVYTRPRSWRGIDVPDVLTSGNHADIDRWRRDRSLVRTAHRRPDLIDRLDAQCLSTRDKEVLAGAGTIITPKRRDVMIRLAREGEAEALSELAANTFPLACPDYVSQDDIAAFIEESLSPSEFERMLASPSVYRILVAQLRGASSELIGYTLTILSGPDGMPNQMVRPGKLELGAAYLSKCYVREFWQGSGVAGAMIERAVADVEAQGRNSQIALGTSIANKRAQTFYKRHGFSVAGRRTFMVGEKANIDDVFVRNITPRSRHE